MGTDKAMLTLGDETFLDIQTDKLKSLGISDIMIVRDEDPMIPGTRHIKDIFCDRGPLGGIHAALSSCEGQCCLFLSVDVPLVPEDFLMELIDKHKEGATASVNEGHDEPLIAVYDSCLTDIIEDLVRDGARPVRALLSETQVQRIPYTGPIELMINCNTPEDLVRIRKIYDTWREK